MPLFDGGGDSLADLGRLARRGEVKQVVYLDGCWRWAGLQKHQ